MVVVVVEGKGLSLPHHCRCCCLARKQCYNLHQRVGSWKCTKCGGGGPVTGAKYDVEDIIGHKKARRGDGYLFTVKWTTGEITDETDEYLRVDVPLIFTNYLRRSGLSKTEAYEWVKVNDHPSRRSGTLAESNSNDEDIVDGKLLEFVGNNVLGLEDDDLVGLDDTDLFESGHHQSTCTRKRPTSMSAVPLPKRIFTQLPSEVQQPAQFDCNLSYWDIIPLDLKEALLKHFTDSNDPCGLGLRCVIRAAGESIKRGGHFPMYLLRRKDLQYGSVKKGGYRPLSSTREEDRKYTKALPPNEPNDDVLQGHYFRQVFHCDGKLMEMSLAYTDNLLLDGTRVSASDIAKLESVFVTEELRVDYVRFLQDFMQTPVSKQDGFNRRYLSVKRGEDWYFSSSETDTKSGFVYPRFRFSVGGVPYSACSMFMTPVVHNGGAPVLIQVDSAYLVHRDGSRDRMFVSTEDHTMECMGRNARQQPMIDGQPPLFLSLLHPPARNIKPNPMPWRKIDNTIRSYRLSRVQQIGSGNSASRSSLRDEQAGKFVRLFYSINT